MALCAKIGVSYTRETYACLAIIKEIDVALKVFFYKIGIFRSTEL